MRAIRVAPGETKGSAAPAAPPVDPASFGTSLTGLVSHNNRNLRGRLPRQLFAAGPYFRHMRVLVLSHNNEYPGDCLKGSIPTSLWACCPALATLDLMGQHDLTGAALPDNIGTACPCLHVIVLADCSGLSGPATPSSLGKLSFLQVLDLSGCTGLSGTIPPSVFHQRSRLEFFSVAGCHRLTGRLPDTLGEAKELQSLHVHGCSGLTGRLPSSLPPNLNSIRLTGTALAEDLAHLPGKFRNRVGAELKLRANWRRYDYNPDQWRITVQERRRAYRREKGASKTSQNTQGSALVGGERVGDKR